MGAVPNVNRAAAAAAMAKPDLVVVLMLMSFSV
jgi:hypothetical protein